MVAIHQQIINLRKQNGWSQIKLANKMGFTKSMMSKIEAGSRRVSIKELKKFAEVFDVTTDYLLGIYTNENVIRENLVDLQVLVESEMKIYYGEEKLSREDRIIIGDMIGGYLWKKKQRKD